MIIVLMGVSGCGKSLIGAHLERRLGWPFYDGDRFHSHANVEKMKAGQPLSDEDRAGWLRLQAAAIRAWREHGDDVILGCSALKQCYRDTLVQGSTTFDSYSCAARRN